MITCAIVSFTQQGAALSLRMREALLFEKPKQQEALLSEEPKQREDCGDVPVSKQQKPRSVQAVSLVTKKKNITAEDARFFYVEESIKDWCAVNFSKVDLLIFIGSAGIAVRTIAPYLVSKTSDPAVLVADEKGKHIISLLSGHLGGGNAWTCYLAERLGADPVLTTASDVNDKPAIDVWAQKNGLHISDLTVAKHVAAAIVEGQRVSFFCDGTIVGEVPEAFRLMTEKCAMPAGDFLASKENDASKETCVPGENCVPEENCVSEENCVAEENCVPEEKLAPGEPVCVVVSVKKPQISRALHLIPKAVVVGVGCKKGKPYEEIRAFLEDVLDSCGIAKESICKLASIDLKKEEPGLLRLASSLQVPFEPFSAEELLGVPGEFSTSAFVSSITGVDNVCERAAVAAIPKKEQENVRFITRKTANNGITVALVEIKWEVSF